MWRKYTDLEPVRRLRNEGRELIGKKVLFTEKRDGENVSVWMDEDHGFHIASHNQEEADGDIQNRMKLVPEYDKVCRLILSEFLDYDNRYIAYGELLKTVSPTRIEPRRKHVHWILFDIWNYNEERYVGYNNIHQKAYHFKIPIVRVADFFIPNSLEELFVKIEEAKKWCKRHRREGVVGKNYGEQIFFKEKVDLPNLPKIKKPSNKPQFPPMPIERCLRALQHAFDEVGEERWKDKRIAMPIVARHFETEAREHNFEPPKNFYRLYIETPLEKIKE